jgi:TatD DNase family protein
MRYFDAHNHLQDERLALHWEQIAVQLPALGVVRGVVAGSGEEDWPQVAELARQYPWVLPSFGVHPWYVKEQSEHWRSKLEGYLQQFQQAGVGEIGLDRWIENADVAMQVKFFTEQLGMAARDNRPATIHCLRAFGLLEETLRDSPRPERGFLLHSYGGPAEMVESFAKLGAYFSVSPYFLHERKARQWGIFRAVPIERLLLETDAPDMWPPDEINPRRMSDAAGKSINHPANIELMYHAMARLRGMSLEALAQQVEQNFVTLFGVAD